MIGDDTAGIGYLLALMAEGRSNAAILVVTAAPEEKHTTSILSNLDLGSGDDDHRRVLAVIAYLRVARQLRRVAGST